MGNNFDNTTDTYRILAQDCMVNNNTFVTGLNNNDLIIGPTGSGKTRNFCKPNIMNANESMVICDTKSNLIKEVGPLLERHNYKVLCIDFKDMKSTCRWNPLSYIKYDRKTKSYNENEIMRVAKALTPTENFSDPFWDHASQQYVETLIAYTLEFLPSSEHTLKSVSTLLDIMGTEEWSVLMQEVKLNAPKSLTFKKYKAIEGNTTAEKMDQSIKGVLSEHLNVVTLKPALAMYSHKNPFKFSDLAKSKTALFINLSDTDRSMDPLTSLFFTQLLQNLCDFADHECPNQRLPIPVKIYLDDFACNFKIPDFDKVITTIRSREISVAVIIQSISQLAGLYGQDKGNTIIDNCDHVLYLGGQSLETARYISERANIPVNDVLDLPLDEAYLFTRGQHPKKVHKYDITSHKYYNELPEANNHENIMNADLQETQHTMSEKGEFDIHE